MTDPFTSLHRDVDRTDPDPKFRQALLTEVSRRIATGNPAPAGHSPEPVVHSADNWIRLEHEPMHSNRPRRSRMLLVAAGLIALVGGLVAIAALRSSDDDSDGTDPAEQPTTTAAPAATTTAPAATTTTEPRPPTDAQALQGMLLMQSEFGPGWETVPTSFSGIATDTFDADVAATIPACAPYIETIFAADDGALSMTKFFYKGSPTEAAGYQTVILFVDEAAAEAMVDALSDPALAECATSYRAQQAEFRPEGFGRSPSEAPFEPVGDQMSFSRFDITGAQYNDGETHGPEELYSAIVRVGRSVTFIGTVHMGHTGDENVLVMSDEQFRQMLLTVVARAEAALESTQSGRTG